MHILLMISIVLMMVKLMVDGGDEEVSPLELLEFSSLLSLTLLMLSVLVIRMSRSELI